MSMYGEPDLADLLPAYYCMARGGRQQNCPTVWRGICTHLFAMAIAIGLCGSGYYYYQFVYIPNHKDSIPLQHHRPGMQSKEPQMPMHKQEKTSANIGHNPGLGETCRKELTNLKDELASIHSWRSALNALITKIEWQQDFKINAAINNALEEYEADGIGIMDYAASYAGGTIVQLSPETRPHPTHRPLSLFKLVNVDIFSSPEEIIRPCVLPGSCFAFRGGKGAILVRLGKSINVGGITLSHGSRMLLGTEGMNSAPKDFEVHGYTDDADYMGTFLGKFIYDSMGGQHQTFAIKKNQSKNKIFEMIELSILSNYGKNEFTCVYRFRVHRRDEEDTAEKSAQTSGGPAIKRKKKCC